MKRTRHIPLLLLLLVAGTAIGLELPRTEAASTLPRDTQAFVRQFGKLYGAQLDQLVRQIENGPKDLAAQRAAARREGIPLKPSELQAPLPAADRNAAPLYLQLTRLLQEKPLDAETDPIRGNMGVHVAHPPEALARVQKLLAE